jgi:hypothetical protein
MLTPRGSLQCWAGQEASNAGPLPLHPIPRSPRAYFEKGQSTYRGCTQFQDHLVLETISHFRIISRLEYATPVDCRHEAQGGR